MKLEKCPYCGGHPKIIRVGDDRQFFIAICSECYKTPVKNHEARLTETGAGLIWNVRSCEVVGKNANRYDEIFECLFGRFM